MQKCARWLFLTAAVTALAATPAWSQQLTVEIDKTVYDLGDTVHITIHNPTTATVYLNSEPGYGIVYLDTETCIYGCLGLPVITEVQPGETVAGTRDTGFYSDPAGTYRVAVFESGTGAPPLPTPPHVEYILGDPTPNESQAWSTVKKLYE